MSIIFTACFTQYYVLIDRLTGHCANTCVITLLAGNIASLTHCPIISCCTKVTKIIPEIRHLPYRERLKACTLPTLRFRQVRGDMIEMYKILTGKYDVDVTVTEGAQSVRFDNQRQYAQIKQRSSKV